MLSGVCVRFFRSLSSLAVWQQQVSILCSPFCSPQMLQRAPILFPLRRKNVNVEMTAARVCDGPFSWSHTVSANRINMSYSHVEFSVVYLTNKNAAEC